MSTVNGVSDVTVRNYMRRQIADHVDPDTGEVCCTTLAEAVAEELNLLDAAGNVPEEVFEIAVYVVELWVDESAPNI